MHGRNVVVVERPSAGLSQDADGLVTTSAEVPIAVLGADCALVALASPDGVVGVAHAGWRGLVAGVLSATVAAMRDLGARDLSAVLGPCIHPECYEFGARQLDLVADAVGSGVRAETVEGRPALDLPFGVRTLLEEEGVSDLEQIAGCTACGREWYSHRARGESSRHALVAWRAGSVAAP